MKEIPAPSPAFAARDCLRTFILLVSCVALVTSGCSARKRPAVSWATAVLVRPIVPSRPALTATDGAEPAPDLRLEFPPQPIRLVAVRNGPTRPRVAAPPTPEAEVAGKPEQPLIVPQLPPAEAQTLQEKMNQSVSAAERNLATTNGKNMNAIQVDLASKVRSFLADAREAARTGDLRRASNLAKKAQVLSEELAGSL